VRKACADQSEHELVGMRASPHEQAGEDGSQPEPQADSLPGSSPATVGPPSKSTPLNPHAPEFCPADCPASVAVAPYAGAAARGSSGSPAAARAPSPGSMQRQSPRKRSAEVAGLPPDPQTAHKHLCNGNVHAAA
jgi:hypothetical protein